MLIPIPTCFAEKYIETYKELAITEMARSRIPTSIKLAQGLIESGFGTSELAKKANNHFGIKCHSGWNGPAYYQTDDAPNECFRKYGNPLNRTQIIPIFCAPTNAIKACLPLILPIILGGLRA